MKNEVRGPKLSGKRWGVVGASLFVIALSWMMVWRAGQGVVIRPFTANNIPMRYIGPADAENIPGVIIAHGFSGSQQLMQGFAYVLAHAGYGTLLFDFVGHAANPVPLDQASRSLQSDMDAAYAALLAQPEIDGRRIALLGHSMGSGAVMAAGITDADQYQATIAVSPTDAPVTNSEPRNLLLQAGQLEPPFVANAEDLLARAGGANVDFANGAARSFQLVPGVEHITILFSPGAHQGALGWLDQTFGAQQSSDYVDVRMGWFVVQLVGWLVLATAVTPLFRLSPVLQPGIRRVPWHLFGLAVAPLAATALLTLMNQIVPVADLGGILIAGALGIWFLFMGLVWWGIGLRPLPPVPRSLLWGLAVFAFLWLAFGLMAQVVWLPWFLIPVRLVRWPLLALALFPWLLAAGWAQQGASTGRRVGWWLGQSVVLMVGLGTAVFLLPGLFFLVLVLPVLPIVIGIMTLVSGVRDDPWASGLGNALFFAWLLLALFPLVA